MNLKLSKIGLVCLLFLLLGLGVGIGVVSANSYFGGHVEMLKEEYDKKIDEYMLHEAPTSGAMHRYLAYELHPKLDEEAESYYNEALNKWLQNQETLSDEEKRELDEAFEDALDQVKANIDAKFAEYGGY